MHRDIAVRCRTTNATKLAFQDSSDELGRSTLLRSNYTELKFVDQDFGSVWFISVKKQYLVIKQQI